MSFAIAKGSLIGSGGGGGGGPVDQGASGSDPWGIKVEHPIEDDGGSDYVRIKDKYSDDNNTYLARIPLSPATDTKLNEIKLTLGSPLQESGTININNFPVIQDIAASSLPLPTGAATENKQDTQITAEQAIQTAVENISSITSTSANQITGNGYLQTISNATDIALSVIRDAINAVRDRLPSSFGAGGGIKIDGSGTALPVSVTSLPLPINAATSTLQTTANTSLSSIDGKIPSNLTVSATRLLVDSSGVTQPVSGTVTANAGTGTFAISAASLPLPTNAATSANQTTANTSLSSIDGKLPALSTNPSTTDSAVPVRQIPAKAPGSLYHVTHTSSITNAPNKLLFGFSNASGANIYVEKIHCLNAQTATHSGTVARLQVQSGSSAITGGTTVTGVSSPALVATSRNPTISGPSGLTWNTNGTLGGTVVTHEQCWWSTDEITANGTGTANEIATRGVYQDVFDFCDDPIVVPNKYSIAVTCDSTAAWNGVTIVDYNLYS